jgi:hypothetical protein
MNIFIAREPDSKSLTQVHWNIVTCPAVQGEILLLMYNKVYFFVKKKPTV